MQQDSQHSIKMSAKRQKIIADYFTCGETSKSITCRQDTHNNNTISKDPLYTLFHRFADLPEEIRIMIWQFSTQQESRIIPIEPYNIGRSLTRIGNSRSTSIENHEVWQAFLDSPHVQQLPYETPNGKLRDAIIRPDVRQLWLVHPFHAYLQTLMETCQESSRVVLKGYSRTFGVFGDRPIILFTSRHDTFYLSKDVLFDLTPFRNFANPGGRFHSDWCWELARVENLAIPLIEYGYENDNDCFGRGWVKQVLSWFPNVKQVTFLCENDTTVNTDVKDLVFVDIADVKFAKMKLLDESEQGHHFQVSDNTHFEYYYRGELEDLDSGSMERQRLANKLTNNLKYGGDDIVFQFEFHRKTLAEFLLGDNVPEGLSDSVSFSRKIMMTSQRKAELIRGNAMDWYRESQKRTSIQLSCVNQSGNEPLYVVADQSTLVRDLIRAFQMKRVGGHYEDDELKRLFRIFYEGEEDTIALDPEYRGSANDNNGVRIYDGILLRVSHLDPAEGWI